MKLLESKNPEIIALLNEPVQTLHYELCSKHFKPYDYDSVLSYFTSRMKDENHHFRVCQNSGQNVGYIWFEEVFRSETAFSKASHYLYIHQISVNPDCRGMGIGKFLFSAALEFAERNGIKRIGLDYWVKNDHVKEIYTKMGFEVEKEVSYLSL